MRKIIGIGNKLRGEDAFGYDLIKTLQCSYPHLRQELMYVPQLTPELCLELLDAKEIIFVDAFYDSKNPYKLTCPVKSDFVPSLSHHISVNMLMEMLNSLYKVKPTLLHFCMAVSNLDVIEEQKEYENRVQQVAKYIVSFKA